MVRMHCLIKKKRQVEEGRLMVSALDFGSSGPGLRPGQEHCVVFLGKRLYSYSSSLHPGITGFWQT